jgi:penicillin-binding protein-related factor A (putative recombinase)
MNQNERKKLGAFLGELKKTALAHKIGDGPVVTSTRAVDVLGCVNGIFFAVEAKYRTLKGEPRKMKRSWLRESQVRFLDSVVTHRGRAFVLVFTPATSLLYDFKTELLIDASPSNEQLVNALLSHCLI